MSKKHNRTQFFVYFSFVTKIVLIIILKVTLLGHQLLGMLLLLLITFASPMKLFLRTPAWPIRYGFPLFSQTAHHAAQAEAGSMLMYYGGDAIEIMLVSLFCWQWFKAERSRMLVPERLLHRK